MDSANQLALVGLAGHDGALLDGDFADIEPELALDLARVGAVAGEALVRKDRPNVAIEVDFSLRPRRVRHRDQRDQSERRDGYDATKRPIHRAGSLESDGGGAGGPAPSCGDGIAPEGVVLAGSGLPDGLEQRSLT